MIPEDENPKEVWRREALILRDALTEEEWKQKSAGIMSRLLNSSGYADAGVVACYASFGSEVDTWPVLQAALRDSKALFCPRVIRHNPPEMEFFRITDLTQLQPGYAGISEPVRHQEAETLSAYIRHEKPDATVLMVMPGVAFSENKDRIGYGGGCYDKYLRTVQSAGDVPMITAAVAFDCQVFAELTGMEAHDIRPDFLFTETGERA